MNVPPDFLLLIILIYTTLGTVFCLLWTSDFCSFPFLSRMDRGYNKTQKQRCFSSDLKDKT